LKISRDSTTFKLCQNFAEIVVHQTLRISYQLTYLRNS